MMMNLEVSDSVAMRLNFEQFLWRMENVMANLLLSVTVISLGKSVNILMKLWQTLRCLF